MHTSDLLGDAVLLTHELRAALHDQLRLVSYETQLAGRSLVTMVAADLGFPVTLRTLRPGSLCRDETSGEEKKSA